MNNTFTLYGGLLGSEDYYALGIGIGGTLGALGALSMDINRADTQFDNQHSFMAINGVRSTSKISRKPTPISLSATIAIPTMAILVLMKPIPAIGTITVAKSEIQFNISQTIFDGVSLYASGSQQDYWGNNDKTGISLLGFPASNGELVTA